MDDETKDLEGFLQRMKAHLAASKSPGNIHGVDPDNPYEIRHHEREAREFLHKRLNLKAKILYVHGFASSGNSGTAQAIRKYLPQSKVISPDLPINPEDALKLLRKIVATEKIDVAVGTSMGGMLAQKLRGVPKILVNPSFHVSETMRKKIGKVPFFNRREDGATEFEITHTLCDAYRKIEDGQFDNITDSERAITYGLFGTDDTVVNNQDEYKQYYSNIIFFNGGHRLSDEAIHDYLIEAILKLTAGY